jgi:non-canonical (house-cleaning) NTP pyrophosphatase
MSDKTGKKQSAGSAEFTLPPRIATKSRKKNHEPSPVVRNIPYFSNLLGVISTTVIHRTRTVG